MLQGNVSCVYGVCAVYTWALGGRLPMWPSAMCHVCVWCVCSIFLGSGWPSTRVAKCYKGDVMVCELDFEQVRVKFYRNDQLVGVLCLTHTDPKCLMIIIIMGTLSA